MWLGDRIQLCLVFLLALGGTHGSHFRGAIITWKPGTNSNEIEIGYRISWRKSYNAGFACDENTIQMGTSIGGTGDIECFEGCYGSIGSLYYKCTDFSNDEDWSSGKGKIIYKLPAPQPETLYFGFSGSAWISLTVGGGGSWMLRVFANLTVRSDTGRINTSPTAEITPIVRLQSDCNHTIALPVNDVDNDIVKCRWAKTTPDECGGVCNGLPNSMLDEDKCRLTYSAVHGIGWFAVALQVEDFSDIYSLVPLSSIPVQFLVQVFDGGDSCNVLSEFVYPTPPDDACIGVPDNTTFESAIVTRVANEDIRLTEIKTISPLGMQRGGLHNISNIDWRMNFTWSPNLAGSTISNVFCFSAVELSGRESEKRCITLLAGVAAPSFVNNTQSPSGKVVPSQSLWTISVNTTDFTETDRETYIRLYNDNDVLVEKVDASDRSSVTIDKSSRVLKFETTSSLLEKQSYYFLFDFGVIRGTSFCKAESEAITDPLFWRFYVRDVTPPKISFQKNPLTFNSTAEIVWTVNEPVVNSTCVFTKPNQAVETFMCSGQWSASDLSEGLYSLTITATDLEENTAHVSHSWKVDTTPPEAWFSKKPNAVSNNNPVHFSWTCPGSCIPACFLIEPGISKPIYCSGGDVNFSLPNLDSNQTYTFQLEVRDQVWNMASINYTWITDFRHPEIKLCDQGQMMTVDCKIDFQPETVCNVSVTDNMDKTPSLTYKDSPTGGCGFVRTWTSRDIAGNSVTKSQNFQIMSNENMTVLRSPPPMSIACGSLPNMTEIFISLFEVQHPCNLDVAYTFVDNVKESCDALIERTWIITDNCSRELRVKQYIRVRQAQVPIYPENGQRGIDLNTQLRWLGPTSNVRYDIYIWLYGTDRPNKADAMVTETVYTVGNFKPGTKYLWQVVFHYSQDNETYLGPVWAFETRHFPDLVVENIEIPPKGYTGQTYEIRWTAVNQGIATQQHYWIDAVFMSWEDDFQRAAQIATVTQNNIILSNDGYSSSATFTLDKIQVGNARFFVNVDYRQHLDEYDITNNLMRSSSTMKVVLTPPPDLQVTSILLSGTSFYSGKEVSLSWTVANLGQGSTKDGSWTDRIWLSANQTITNEARLLKTFRHRGDLDKDKTVTTKTEVTLPEFVFGDFFFLAEVDVYNVVYEQVGESNNLYSTDETVRVLLTFPPDLIVKSIDMPVNWMTGDTVTISWTIENAGDDSPPSQPYWRDSVVIKSVNGTWYENIGIRSHYGVLGSSDSYTSSVPFYVPPSMASGDYSITVHTDIRNNVFEYTHENNNVLTTSVNIKQALPDLNVNNFNISLTNEFNSTRLDAIWTVENIGYGKTLELIWSDTLYIKRPNGHFFEVLGQYSVRNEHPLEQGQNYINSATVYLPLTISGQISVMVEAGSEYFSVDKSQTNNFYTIPFIDIELRAADMVLQSNFEVSDNMQGGNDINVKYTVLIQGNKNVTNTTWVDSIYIAENENSVIPFRDLVVTTELNETLNVYDSYTRTATLKLPNDISGPYFLVVDVNTGKKVFEGGKVSNNRIDKLVNIEISPAADLSVQSLTVTDKFEVDGEQILSVIWEVKNIGNSMNEVKMWTDKIVATNDPLTNDTNIDLGTFTVQNILISQSSYELQRNIILPLKISGNIYVCVQVDATNSVYESSSVRNNNECTSTPIHVQPSQGPRLFGRISDITTTSQNDIVAPGSEMEIGCNVLNVGDRTTSKSSWIDVIYIADVQVSTTTQLRNIGLPVKDVLHVGSLRANEDYNFSSIVTIPQGISGHPKFYVIPDDIDRQQGGTDSTGTPDTSAVNKSTAIETVTSYLSTEQISFLLPNLVVNTSTVLHTMVGGQPVTLDYNITNIGNITTFQVWYDSVFISDDYIIDAFDKKLKSELRPVQLDAGETLSLNISFFLPLDLATKSYFLAIICDSRNDVFEKNEDDNALRLTFDLQAKASTDLFVKHVIAPESVEYGNTMSVTWEVSNNGTKQAQGYKCDSVYLSDDLEWDINDHQLGQPSCTWFRLDANQTEVVQGALSHTTPHVKAQNYTTLIKTRSNIIDVLPDNNVGISEKKTKISYKRLEFDQLKLVQLHPYQYIAFRLANVLEDKTIVINVTSNNQESFNSVYIKSRSPATLYNFDQISEDPNSANHIMTVPDTLNEDYYVLIENTGFITSSGAQTIEISVKYATFEVMMISPEMLLRGSQTTIHISGTLFPFDMQAELHFNDSTIKPFTAKSTRVFSTMDAYATFFVPKEIPLTKAFLVLRYNSGRGSKITTNMISIGTGTEGYLSTSVENLGRFRAGETVVITVNLQNNGNSDLISPILTIQTTGGGAIKLLDSHKEEIHKHQYLMIGNPSKGPSGIFPSRTQGSIRFEAKQNDASGSSSMQFKVSALKLNDEIRNPYLDLKEELRPSHYNEKEWEKVWINFLKLTGNSTLSLSRKVSEVLSDMSLAGRRLQKLEDITNFLIEYADAPYFDRIILRESVFNVATDSAIALAIEYTLSARIGSREQSGFLGKGWILPLWDSKIKHMDESTLTLTLEKEDYEFINVDENVFIHSKLGTISKVGSDMVLRRRQDDKEFHFDSATLLLKSIDSLVDNSSLSLHYKNNLLAQIKHSSGPFVSIVYNDLGNILSMELLNSTLYKQEKKTFLYNFESGLLRSVRSDSVTTQFRYNNRDSSLRYVMYDQETMIVFEYNSFGHLTARRFIAAGDQVEGLEYTYSEGAMVHVHAIPENRITTYTFAENGELIRIHTNNTLPEKTASTMFSQATYLGDVMILKKTFDRNTNHYIIEDGNGDQIKTVFNNKGQLSQFIDGRGNKYQVDRNENGSLKTVVYPDGTNKSYTYFENGHFTTLQSGDVKRYEFNERQQVIKKTGSFGEITSYDYDESGSVVTATNDIGEIRIQQTANLPASVMYANHSVDYTYDNKQRVTAIVTSSGYKVGYVYNRIGQMTQVTGRDGNVLVDAKYNSAGRIIKKTLGNRAMTVYNYDSSTGLLTELLNYYPNGTLSSFFNYTYSSKNRRISVDTTEGTWKFRYDRAGQVVSMLDPRGNVTEYTYDETKNRKTVSVNGVDVRNNVNDMNQYIEYGKMKYKHDKNGNLVERESETGELERFVYDDENKLLRYESATTNCTYRYDAFGFLYSKKCSDVTTQYVMNMRGNYGLDILEQIRTENGQTRKVAYYHGDELIGLIAQKQDNEDMNYFMFDPLGSVVSILDENGDLLSKFERNPFGEVLSSGSAVQSSVFTFIGQWGVVDMQEIPGTFLMRARLYDSYTGRFVSADPLGVKAHSKNFYAYCSNDPVHFNDPEGTCPMCYLTLFTAGKGAVTGLFNYVKNTPVGDWTWGGAAGSSLTGGLKGALDPWRKRIPKPIEILLDAGATVAGNWAQHAIDKEPYTFDDAKKDYISSAVDDTIDHLKDKYSKFKDLVEGIDNACGKVEKYTGYRPGMCDWPDKVKDAINDLVDDVLDWIRSRDPNDMLGPAGYGPAHFIAKDLVMEYKIRFENDENATAPAQYVYIEHSYSEHLDPRTFQMKEFGFGNFTQEIPDRQKSFQGTINMTTEKGFIVRVFAGLDIVKKMFTWELQTLDPQTGEAPIDPGIGFLPPNNGTTGQGYVSFSVKPRRDAAHLASINANASIFFDENEPIDTPNIFHTIDNEPPVLNSSIISETASVDSVTVSLRPTDSGSGPAFVDIFQKQDNGLVLFKEGVTENIIVLHLSAGESYNLLLLPVDHVGNRQEIPELDAVKFINIVATVEPGNCSCSDNGNCSWTNVCICNEGYYGPTCSSTTKPLEPPVLDMKAHTGFVNEPIQLKISARNMSGLLNDISIIVSGFPDDTTFSQGTKTPSGSLVLESSEFGLVTMTTSFEGLVKLDILVLQRTVNSNLTRSGDLEFMVYTRPEGVNIQLNGCFLNGKDGIIQARLNSSVDITFTSSVSSNFLSHNVQLIVPSWVSPVGEYNVEHMYNVEDELVDYILNLNAPLQTFNMTVVVKLHYSGLPTLEVRQDEEISTFCDQVSTCDCVEGNIKFCKSADKTCVCKAGWTGDRCGTDVDECKNKDICKSYANTACQNKEGGYDCSCRVGYRMEKNQCLAYEVKRNDTLAPTDKKYSVSIRIDVDIPRNDNLEVRQTFEYYREKAVRMLEIFYKGVLGDGFVSLFVLGMRRGSLIIDHEVVTVNNNSTAQSMSLAVTRLAHSGKSSLTFDGQPAVATQVSLDNFTVTGTDVCEVFTSIHSCDKLVCVVKENKPECHPVSPNENDDNEHSVLTWALAIGIPLALFILITIVCVCCRKSRNERKEESYIMNSRRPLSTDDDDAKGQNLYGLQTILTNQK